MPDNTKCPFCSSQLSKSYLYVRGLGASLHRGTRADIGFLSRADLQQINLGEISQTDTGAQAVIDALHCDSCDSMSFKARR